MKRVNRGFAVVGSLWLGACGDSELSSHRVREDQGLPSLQIAIDRRIAAGIRIDTARSSGAPAVRFAALIRRDPNHSTLLAAPAQGTVARVRAAALVRRGDTLATIVSDTRPRPDTAVLRAAHNGAWQPFVRPGQAALEGSSLGRLDQQGFWLAVGSVSETDAAVMHTGDRASVYVSSDSTRRRNGWVEWVRFPDNPHPSWADVAVEFEDTGPADISWVPGMVTVTPGHAVDSAVAVPAAAVALLHRGSAVFIPVGSARFEVRWIVPGPPAGHRILVRRGLRPGEPVALGALLPLLAAARDSLHAMNQRTRR